MTRVAWVFGIVAPLFAAIVVSGCGMAADEGSVFVDGDDDESGGDADADGDANRGGDSDSDADWGGDSDADSDADGDADEQTEGEPEPEPEEEPDVCDGAQDSRVTQYVSADDSNSQAAPVVAREYIDLGWGGSVAPRRLYEFLNYYTFDYAAAEEGTLRIVPQLRSIEGDDAAKSLLVAVVAPALDPEARRPLSLTFSVDTSGSMDGEGIARARAVVRAIASELREGDFVSVVAWDDQTSVVLESHAIEEPDDPALLAAADGLVAGGSTDLEQGLRLAYDLAEANYMPGRTNRVILISDGGANTGITSEELIGAAADEAEGEGIYLIGVGASSPGSFSDPFMDRVTDIGRGAYVYVDSEDEARLAFQGERFLQNLEIAARNVQLSIDLPEWTIVDEFSGEQISTNPEEVRPQNLSANDAMLYHMTLRGCAEGGIPADSVFRFRVTWSDRLTGEARETSFEATAAVLLESTNTQQAKANAIIAYAKALSELLGVDDPAAYAAATRATIDEAIEMRPNDAELVEIRDLFDLASDW